MHKMLPPLRFTGAEILRDGEMQRRSLAIADGRITKGPLPEIDLRGYLLLPGIVDLLGGGLERQIAPHPLAPVDLGAALTATDREAAANGVTTAWLAQGWSWEGGLRGPEAAERLLAALDRQRGRLGTDLRVVLCCETHLVDTTDRLLAAVRRHGVDQVIFTNRLDAVLEAAAHGPAEGGGFAPPLPLPDPARLAALKARAREVPRHLCRLADAFDLLDVRYGSRGDPDGETRETFSMLGAGVAALPASRKAAAAAKAMNDPVLMPAPDLLPGAGSRGAPRAGDLIAQGLCDALVSDYSYAALARAAFALADAGVRTLPGAWALISSRPADILRLPDRGRLDFGRRADLIAVNAETRAVEMTIAGGVLTYLGHGAARRFACGSATLDIAAE